MARSRRRIRAAAASTSEKKILDELHNFIDALRSVFSSQADKKSPSVYSYSRPRVWIRNYENGRQWRGKLAMMLTSFENHPMAMVGGQAGINFRLREPL